MDRSSGSGLRPTHPPSRRAFRRQWHHGFSFPLRLRGSGGLSPLFPTSICMVDISVNSYQNVAMMSRAGENMWHAKLPALIDEYDALMEPYLKSVGRGNEVNWSANTLNYYSFVYFSKVYPIMKLQGFKNDK